MTAIKNERNEEIGHYGQTLINLSEGIKIYYHLMLKFNLNWAMAISLVLVLNISSLVLHNIKIHRKNETTAMEALKNEMISNTIYNY